MEIKLIRFFFQESDVPKGTILFMTITSGISYAILLFVINKVAGTDIMDVEIQFFPMYLILCVIFIVCKRYLLDQSTTVAEGVIRRVRVRLVGKLRHTELQFLEKTGHGEIYARITQDTDILSQSTPILISFFDASVSFVAIFLYIAWLSQIGFLLILVFLSAGSIIFVFNYMEAKEEIKKSRLKEAHFFDALDNVLAGFKELKVNYRKNSDVFADIETISRETERLKVSAGFKFNKTIVFYYLCYFILIGCVLFILPTLSDTRNDIIVKLIATLLYIYGSMDALLRGIPACTQSNVAVANLEKLEAKLDAFGVYAPMTSLHIPTDFKKIVLESVCFRYLDKNGETSFAVGPIDLSIRKGEILFIVGGNGSGKSTLLKLLLGLYYPEKGGRIILDEQVVKPSLFQSYRELFSIILTDFYLFKKLYGLESVDEKEVESLLCDMELQRKTRYIDGKFTDTDLSTGQRKRLAYIASVLEDKPIYVFDEWAADQDPTFRKHFYEVLLKDLKRMGKTIIAVTHDDKYFDKADQVIKMEEGKLITDI